jgi:sucrose-6F-phosphate phosphohydrolase
MKPYLIVSDLDGTLLGDGPALQVLADWLRLRQSQLVLVYSSGRSHTSILNAIREFSLPEPIAIIGSVGTEIREFPSGERYVGWPAVEPFGWSVGQVLAALACVPGLELQPVEFQSAYKVSYYLHNASDEDLQRIETQLRSFALSADIIYSSQRDLDVLPRGVNKGTAARHLARHRNISADRIIACGDSGNDASMFDGECRGVIVANALPELRALAGARIFRSSRCHAAGVLEGLCHWLGEPA